LFLCPKRGTPMVALILLFSVTVPPAVVYRVELKSFYYTQKDKWLGVTTPVVVLSKPVHSGISIGVNHTKSSDVSDVIDVEFVPTYDEVLVEVRGGAVSSDVVEDSPTYEEVVAAYKKVRAKASSKPAPLSAQELIKAAKHAAQFPVGYFSQVVNYKDLPQLLTRGRHNESQQPLANFARVFRLPSDEARLAVVNDRFWQDGLLRSFANATDAELLSVYSNWADVSNTSACFGYKPILAFVLALRNEANS
jgi:hypothetical protein